MQCRAFTTFYVLVTAHTPRMDPKCLFCDTFGGLIEAADEQRRRWFLSKGLRGCQPASWTASRTRLTALKWWLDTGCRAHLGIRPQCPRDGCVFCVTGSVFQGKPQLEHLTEGPIWGASPLSAIAGLWWVAHCAIRVLSGTEWWNLCCLWDQSFGSPLVSTRWCTEPKAPKKPLRSAGQEPLWSKAQWGRLGLWQSVLKSTTQLGRWLWTSSLLFFTLLCIW